VKAGGLGALGDNIGGAAEPWVFAFKKVCRLALRPWHLGRLFLPKYLFAGTYRLFFRINFGYRRCSRTTGAGEINRAADFLVAGGGGGFALTAGGVALAAVVGAEMGGGARLDLPPPCKASSPAKRSFLSRSLSSACLRLTRFVLFSLASRSSTEVSNPRDVDRAVNPRAWVHALMRLFASASSNA
jgi:hypothetical protein